ncbi:GNAT family N-acetyltransferase [Haloimpatiens sp. FM7315]|uniref:GNAT family N-acetyltransferase n=1 Tax=Haloimpatiens sp. FM7315 TaxID=3298609 RepID=UPI0035A310BB
MFIFRKAKNTDIKKLRRLNLEKNSFNNLNKDFFSYYDKVNIFEKIFILKELILLQDTLEKRIIGYLWIHKLDINNYKIKSIYIEKEYVENNKIYDEFKKALISNSSYVYTCEKNSFNNRVLEIIGFIKQEGFYEMSLDMKNIMPIKDVPYISFEKFTVKKDEKIRCCIQNAIFENANRIPLTVEDIYYEEQEDYFYKDGCFFIKYKDTYIGYGQIIFEDLNEPYIVNFGIIPEFRNRGYAKQLLNFIVNTLYNEGFTKSYIKVSCDNDRALSLYKKMNFLITKENYIWKLTS